MKLDLENNNVFTAALTVEEARRWLDDVMPEDVANAMDNAQAHVHGRNGPRAYLVITIEG
jgi:hypothetical protein